MELSIDTIVKIVIILMVIVVVGASLFLFWQNYLKPYFSGIGKEVAGIAIFSLKTKRFKNMNCLKKS